VVDGATPQQPCVESSERFGELLVREQMITQQQREIALRLQMMLHRYRKNARLGGVLLKAGRITASHPAL
jgi:hypothetical protein